MAFRTSFAAFTLVTPLATPVIHHQLNWCDITLPDNSRRKPIDILY